MKKAIYPGTFDPITNGHLDIIKRALNIFDFLIVAIAKNEEKKPMFSFEKRIEMVKKATKNLDRIEVVGFNELLAKFISVSAISIFVIPN